MARVNCLNDKVKGSNSIMGHKGKMYFYLVNLDVQIVFVLSPLIFKLFKPFFEVVLTKWLNTAKEMLLAHCAADAWFLTDSVMMLPNDVRICHYGTMATPYVMLSSSAYKFYLVIQVYVS